MMKNQDLILKLQEQLTGDLIGLARSAEGSMHRVTATTHEALLEGLAYTIPATDADEEKLQKLIARVEDEKRKLVPNCFNCAVPCGRTNRFNMESLWSEEGKSAALRILLLQGLRCLAVYVHQACQWGPRDENINMLFYRGLYAVGRDDWSQDDLLNICLEVGEAELRYRGL